jgi:hypothetical protein
MDRKPLKENSGPASKKAKSSSSSVVLTFALSHSPVQVELLESLTIYQLVDIICCETDVGMSEAVYEHMWDVHVPGKGKFNSSDEYADMSGLQKASQAKLQQLGLTLNTTLELKYDYGATSYYSITLMNKSTTTEAASNFPRRQKTGGVLVGFTPFETDAAVDLNAAFPNLNTWTVTASQLSLNVFQAGKKKNWGFFERGNDGTRHMIYLPTKPKNLADYLHTMDYAAQFKPTPFHYTWYSMVAQFKPTPFHYTWYSMVVLLHDNAAAYNKYVRELEPGFCEAEAAPPAPAAAPSGQAAASVVMNLEQVFPRLPLYRVLPRKRMPTPPRAGSRTTTAFCAFALEALKSSRATLPRIAPGMALTHTNRKQVVFFAKWTSKSSPCITCFVPSRLCFVLSKNMKMKTNERGVLCARSKIVFAFLSFPTTLLSICLSESVVSISLS